MSKILFAESRERVQPVGVRVLGVACLAAAVYLAGNGLLVMFGAVSFASGAYLLGGLEVMGPGVYFLVAASVGILGLALLSGWRWSRTAAILGAALMIASAVMPVSAAVIYSHVQGIVIHGLKIILAIVVIRYLFQPEVADYFSARSG